MNLELFWLKDILIILLTSFVTFAIGKIIEEISGEDYYNAVIYVLIGIIGLVPLVITIFFGNDFNTPFYSWYQDFTTRYIFDCIVGVALSPIWRKILDYFDFLY